MSRGTAAGTRAVPASRRVAALVGLVAVTACGGTAGGTTADAARSGGSGTATTAAASPGAIRPVTADPRPALPISVTGTDGVTSTIRDVGRIVVLDGGVAEIVWSLGLGGAVVGRDVSTTFAEARGVEVVTSGHTISAEGVLARRPTLVLADVRTRPRTAVEQLRAAGVPVVTIGRATRLDQIDDRIRAVAAAVGLVADGERLVRRVDREVRSAAAGARLGDGPPPRVAFLYVRGTAGVYLLGGRGSGADSLLAALGAVDVGADAGLADFTPLTPEALVAARPDVLLVMTEGLESVGGTDGLLALNGVAQTPAARNRRVVAVDDGLLLGFGPRTPLALAEIAAGLAAGSDRSS